MIKWLIRPDPWNPGTLDPGFDHIPRPFLAQIHWKSPSNHSKRRPKSGQKGGLFTTFGHFLEPLFGVRLWALSDESPQNQVVFWTHFLTPKWQKPRLRRFFFVKKWFKSDKSITFWFPFCSRNPILFVILRGPKNPFFRVFGPLLDHFLATFWGTFKAA